MRILVTAGNTQTPIDRVRCITNIFSGRTGTQIALEAFRRDHEVCLLTSHPEVVDDLFDGCVPSLARWRVRPYRTFADLQGLMEKEITSGAFDAIIHVAAVSDYALAGAFTLSEGACFVAETRTWHASGQPHMVDAGGGKVKSNHQELWLRLMPTPKLVDLIRGPWGFGGILVKFKLEVGVSENELKTTAEASRRHSQADFIVANTLEGMNSWALLQCENHSQRVDRSVLASSVVSAVEIPNRR
jgi:phosphopantothenate-cysteine ligase/phosphopantothenoylcysteine decarboxylase/phosphopantothenate--cysteine ligase